MGAVAIEYNDPMSMKQRLFTGNTFSRIKFEVIPKLKDIASTRKALLDAV